MIEHAPSATEKDRRACDNECAPERRCQHRPGRLAASDLTGGPRP